MAININDDFSRRRRAGASSRRRKNVTIMRMFATVLYLIGLSDPLSWACGSGLSRRLDSKRPLKVSGDHLAAGDM
jgi:hypothetical protein